MFRAKAQRSKDAKVRVFKINHGYATQAIGEFHSLIQQYPFLVFDGE
jgi:hypothetical protein